jgi:hypothetical protein
MPLFTVILVISIVAKNIVNVIKMLTVKAQALDAVWLLLSGVFGGLIVWALEFQVNIFSFMGVETTTRISIVSGVLVGLMGQDVYKIMKLIQEKTNSIKAQ